jgi:hypothetical protein
LAAVVFGRRNPLGDDVGAFETTLLMNAAASLLTPEPALALAEHASDHEAACHHPRNIEEAASQGSG